MYEASYSTDPSSSQAAPTPALKKQDDFALESYELRDTSQSQPDNTDPKLTTASGSGFAWHSQDTTASSFLHGHLHEDTDTTAATDDDDDALGSIDEDIDFPEGGLKANLVVFGSFMGLVPVFGLTNAVGAIEAYVSSHQLANVSTSSVSWIFSMFVFIAFSCAIFSGAFFDRNGTRPPMLIGTVFFCGGLFATGNCVTVYQFVLSFGLMTGFGLGMLMSPLVGVVSHYFKKKRATACSFATTGGSVGGIIMPLILRDLYPKVGFAWAMRILSFMCLGFLIFALIFAKEGISKTVSNDAPEIEPSSSEANKKSTNLKKVMKVYVVDMFDYKSLTELKFLFCTFAVALSEASLMLCSIYFPSYAIRRGFSENTSYLLVTVINTTGILGRYIPGYAADKFLGRFNVAILTLIGTTIVTFVLWLPFGYNLKILFVYAALYGFCSGSILSLSPVCCGQISRTDQFGKRYSTMYLIVALAMLAAVPIGGAIIEDGSVKSYNNLIIFASMLNVGGILSYIVSRYCCVGFKLCKF